jgi:uncharacterized membrane protein YhaH (DUF805 family)
MRWYLKAFKQYSDFSGRAQRSEYWYFMLFMTVIMLVLVIIDIMLDVFNDIVGLGFFSGIFVLVHFLPAIAVSIRRLHDINRTGWWYLTTSIPFIGIIVYIIIGVLDSKEDNQYGENPKVNKSSVKTTTPVLTKSVIKIREHFRQEQTWRLFIILQAIGLFVILYLFNTTSSYSRGDEFDWYIGILFLFPYLISKSINWINEANKKSND